MSPWAFLSTYLTTPAAFPSLRTLTIRPPPEPGLFVPGTASPSLSRHDHTCRCWWYPARVFVSQLCDPASPLRELRLKYRTHWNSRTGQWAVFREEGKLDVEALYVVRMLRVPRWRKVEEWEAEVGDEGLEGLMRIGRVRSEVKAYNEELLRRWEGKGKEEKEGFVVVRRETEGFVVDEREMARIEEGRKGMMLVLRSGGKTVSDTRRGDFEQFVQRWQGLGMPE
ncbi:hypothetical protein EV356DRAFT_517616 [Viridothelium virens]|uniref:Uncharacterized protein n=1 Tax=Viridothelium virens TaxID=1048519 RepID=A0A6A6H3P8_VIRVR|nr:hypothetical protein EV356DRAFT_517616 [Viridothelium virens]